MRRGPLIWLAGDAEHCGVKKHHRPASLAGARLVVAHIHEEVIIGSPGFCDRAALRSGYLDRQLLDLPVRRNQTLRRNQTAHRRVHDPSCGEKKFEACRIFPIWYTIHCTRFTMTTIPTSPRSDVTAVTQLPAATGLAIVRVTIGAMLVWVFFENSR